jgi:hypothetical protein
MAQKRPTELQRREAEFAAELTRRANAMLGAAARKPADVTPRPPARKRRKKAEHQQAPSRDPERDPDLQEIPF